jgi:transposase-like protein
MTIVNLGSPKLQVPREKNRREYLEKIWVQIESMMLYVVERCLSEALETEVSRALGRRAYEPCEQAAFGASEAYCGRCRSRDRRKFRRNGHYPRFLDTHWGRVSFYMPQVICRCGGAVCIDFQLLRPYQRMWDDLEGQIRERSGQGLSLRQTKAELDGLLAGSVGLRKINEVVHALAQLAPSQQEAERTDIPPVVRLDGLWVKMMEATGEVKKDRLGRLRAVKTGVSRPILVAQGVWPAIGRQEILTWLLEQDEGTQSWQNLLDHLYRLGIGPYNGLQLLIGDGSPGLQSAWQARFWQVPFQRCIFHKLRNIRQDLIAPTGLAPGQVSSFKWRQIRRTARIWQAPSEHDAYLRLRQLTQSWQDEQPHALATLLRDFEKTLSFFAVQAQASRHGQIWPAKALRTTSPLEREFRSDRKRLRQSVLFHSQRGWQAIYGQIQLRKIAKRNGLFLDQHQRDLERQLAVS